MIKIKVWIKTLNNNQIRLNPNSGLYKLKIKNSFLNLKNRDINLILTVKTFKSREKFIISESQVNLIIIFLNIDSFVIIHLVYSLQQIRPTNKN
jgi:hypothetical protein